MQRKPINFKTDPYILKKEKDMRQLSEQQLKLMAERKNLMDKLDIIEKKLDVNYSAFHKARSDMEVYQETGRKP